MNKLAPTIFSVEDKRDLKVLAEEMPDLRLLIDELMETLEILGDENLMRVFMKVRKTSKKTGWTASRKSYYLSAKSKLYDPTISEIAFSTSNSDRNLNSDGHDCAHSFDAEVASSASSNVSGNRVCRRICFFVGWR